LRPVTAESPPNAEDMRVLKRCRTDYSEEFPVIVYPVKSAKGAAGSWLLYDSFVDELREAFPDKDIEYECRVAFAWLRTHPHKQKTARGMCGFLMRWMRRSNHDDNGGNHEADRR